MKKTLKNSKIITPHLVNKPLFGSLQNIPFFLIKLFFLFLLYPAILIFAQNSSVSVTVYNQNLALVRQTFSFQLEKGEQNIRIEDVAKSIDPTSVHLRSLNDPQSLTILEQLFEYDLIGSNKVLSKFINQTIQLIDSKGNLIEGKLLNAGSDLLLANENEEITLIKNKDIHSIKFPKLPDGLNTKPTLVWLVKSEKKKSHQLEIEYLTHGMNWTTEYVAILNEEGTQLHIDAWISIDNKSGKNFENANVSVVAGDLNLARNRGPVPQYKTMAVSEERYAQDVSEQEQFEYHLYKINRPVSIGNNQLKQIRMFKGDGVNATKKYVLNSRERDQRLQVYLRFKNDKNNSLGLPFPAGRFRVYQDKANHTGIFLGEARIKHTPEQEWIEILLGAAFDLAAERKQVRVDRIGKQQLRESYEIIIKNQKSQNVAVSVIENLLYRTSNSNWKIIASSHEYSAKDARSIEFKLNIPAKKETKLTYTVEYSW